MAAIEGKCCFDNFKDDTFYKTWFDSQFPIKCVAQIIIMEDMLKMEQAQQVLLHRFEQNIYPRSKYSSNLEILRDVLSEHFTKDVAIELYGNIITNAYNILNFKSSRILKCLKIIVAKKQLKCKEGGLITDQIIDTEVLKMWFDKNKG